MQFPKFLLTCFLSIHTSNKILPKSEGHCLPKVSQKVSAQDFFSYTESLVHCFATYIGGITPVISMKGLQRWIWPTELTLMRHRGYYQLKGQSLFLL